MNAARLLEYFDRIADAPDAIPRLRKFILDLAVRGKLVDQDPNDESASELMKRVQACKVRLIKERKIKNLEISLVAEGEAPFVIPGRWVWTRLGAIGDWGAGSTPSRGDHDLYGGGVTWLKSGELNDNVRLAGSSETVSELAIKKGSFRINRLGDVLIAMYGATIGKLAILAETAVTNQAVCGCTPFDGVFNRFLFLYLLSQREQFHAASEGGAQPNISKVKIIGTPFPLPPLAEQHRIVAKVDELMAHCDRLEGTQAKQERRRNRLATASLKRIGQPEDVGNGEEFQENVQFYLHHLPRLTTRPEHVKELRQTILNLAVRGKLVPQDPNDESLLDCCLKTSHVAQPPFSIPNNWRWSNLPTLGHLVGGGTPSKDNDEFWKGDIPWIAPKDMKRDIIDKSNFNITEEAVRSSATKLVKKSSVLFVVRGMILVHSFPVAISGCRLAINQDMKAVEVKCKMSSRFLLLCLKGLKNYFLDKVQRSSHGTCRLVGEDYCSVLIPIPPLAEQHRIVAKVDELMNLCDQLEVQLATSQRKRSRLLEATLCEALGVTCMPVARPTRPTPSPVLSAPPRSESPFEGQSPRLVDTPKAAVQGSLVEQPKPPTASPRASGSDIPSAILAQMQPGQEYSRAQLADALGLSVYEWNMAIRELKESGRVVQTGERRGARYRVLK